MKSIVPWKIATAVKCEVQVEKAFNFSEAELIFRTEEDDVTIGDKNSWNGAQFNEIKTVNITNTLTCVSEQDNTNTGGISQKKWLILLDLQKHKWNVKIVCTKASANATA